MKYLFTFHAFDEKKAQYNTVQEHTEFLKAFEELCQLVALMCPNINRRPRKGGTTLKDLGFECQIYGMKNGKWKIIFGMDDLDLYFWRPYRLKSHTLSDFFQTEIGYWMQIDTQEKGDDSPQVITEEEEKAWIAAHPAEEME